MAAKIWKLTFLISDMEFKRRYRTVAAAKNLSLKEFGMAALERAIVAAEQEIAQQEEQAA